ncbi:hypothetical protein TNCV_3631421 [Trichonephila clavipes]|nr:hypothetical protein TNCV_3631421 [Trichonephila clavipes]
MKSLPTVPLKRQTRSHPYTSQQSRVSFKDMEVCAAIKRDAFPDNQVFSAVMVNFFDIGSQAVGPLFFSQESTARITDYADQGLISEDNGLPSIHAPIPLISAPF